MILRNRSARIRCGWLAAALCGMVVLVGCDESAPQRRRGAASRAETHDGLFDSVADSLEHLERFDTAQIHKQVCDRLNQWYLQEKPKIAWRPDPLLGDLSPELRKAAELGALERVRFENPEDAWFLQQAVWLRDVSNVARGDRFADLAVARRLFDWTVRNIQLEEPAESSDPSTTHWPYETLLYGRGTPIDRAWVFILLARQQGLEVVMLGLADAQGGLVRPWLPALLLDGELYLFDCRLGLPIPGPADEGVATLAQVAADEELLRRLDLDNDHPYPVRAEDLEHVVAFVEGSPAGLSQRMALVESRLSGEHEMKLTSPGTALAERVEKLPRVDDAKLWPVPFEVARWKAELRSDQARAAAREMVLYQALPILMRGRALHFQGEYEGEEGAKRYYLSARPSEQQIENYKLPEETLKQMSSENAARLEAVQILLMREGKQNASFWLGLIFFEQEDYRNAIDFLAKRTLDADHNGRWTPSARYNLARAYEADGKPAQAIELYESDTDGPQSHGNRLRARWLKEKTSAAEPQESS